MGKIILGETEIKKIYLGETDVKKIYLGSTEVWSANSVRVPPWFPEGVDPVEELYSYWGTDLSSYYVDVCIKVLSGVTSYVYYRCYCTTNGLVIRTNNMSPPTQIALSYSINNSRVAYREIDYSNAGTVNNRSQVNWDSYSRNIASGNFDPNEMYIIEQGSVYTAQAYGGVSFHIIPLNN